jgi:hypothetical protein
MARCGAGGHSIFLSRSRNLCRSPGCLGLEPLNRENRGHSVLLSWCKIDRSVQDITGLDAKKLPPFAIAQVW